MRVSVKVAHVPVTVPFCHCTFVECARGWFLCWEKEGKETETNVWNAFKGSPLNLYTVLKMF